MLEKQEAQYEKVVLVGLITREQSEEKLTEYMDELEFLAYTAGATVGERFTQRMDKPDRSSLWQRHNQYWQQWWFLFVDVCL